MNNQPNQKNNNSKEKEKSLNKSVYNINFDESINQEEAKQIYEQFYGEKSLPVNSLSLSFIGQVSHHIIEPVNSNENNLNNNGKNQSLGKLIQGKSINNYINIYIIINDIDSKMERSNNSNGKKENKEEKNEIIIEEKTNSEKLEENKGNLKEKRKKIEVSAKKEVDGVFKEEEKKKGTEVCAFNQKEQEQQTEKDQYIARLEAENAWLKKLLKENNIDYNKGRNSWKKDTEKKQGDGGNN